MSRGHERITILIVDELQATGGCHLNHRCLPITQETIAGDGRLVKGVMDRYVNYLAPGCIHQGLDSSLTPIRHRY